MIATIDQAIHVDTLHDTDIDALVDRYIFGYEAWCSGEVTRVIDTCHLTYRCTICGSVEEYGFSGYVFGPSKEHPRLVPRYTATMATAWIIVELMKRREEVGRFAALVNEATLHALAGCPLFATPRIIAVAALKALGIIDSDGFVTEQVG